MQTSGWKHQIIVLFVFFLCSYFIVINIFLPENIREKISSFTSFGSIDLGLDLKGGSHLLFEVDVDSWKIEFLQKTLDFTSSLLRDNQINYSSSFLRRNSIIFQLKESWQRQKAINILKRFSEEFDIKLLPGGYIKLLWNSLKQEQAIRLVIDQSVEVIKKRVNELGIKDTTVQYQGENFILVQLSGEKDIDRAKKLVGKTARLTFHLVKSDVRDKPADEITFQETAILPSEDGYHDDYTVLKKVLLGGENLVEVHPVLGRNGQPQVFFRFNRLGKLKFSEITGNNKGGQLAITLDGRIISAPFIKERVSGGEGVISGNFSRESANELAVLMRAGALIAPMSILEERTVGPELGEDSIISGKRSVIYSFFAVFCFMILRYSFFGLIANIALILNIVLLMVILSIIKATLTLSGIAGIALTIGMAVDANILINERIREEFRKGCSVESAINKGYKHALSAIIDSNFTTSIGACSLIFFGSGSIKGFGLTLAIGLCSSTFTSFIITRSIFNSWNRRYKPTHLPISLFRHF